MTAIHPLSEHKRHQVLKQLNILDTPEESLFQDAAMLAAQICQVPIALVTLTDRDRSWFKAKIGLDQAEASKKGSFFSSAIDQRGVLIVEDALKDPRFAKHALVKGPSGVRFYAGSAILAGGVPVGTLSVMDRVPRVMNAATAQCLEALARQLSAALELRLHTEASTSDRC